MKIKIAKAFILCLLFSTSCSENHPDNIIGIWQDSYVIASGWRDNYQFFPNGLFTFHYNQMICDKRTLKFSGTWALNDGILTLTTTHKVIVEGGILVEATGSCASEFDIEGGEIKTIVLPSPEVQKIKLTAYKIDNRHDKLEKMKFHDKIFWRMTTDPNDY